MTRRGGNDTSGVAIIVSPSKRKRGRPRKDAPKVPVSAKDNRAPILVNRRYFPREKAQMAKLAGAGKSAAEIARIMHMTPSRVTAMLGGLDVQLVFKRPGEEIRQLRARRRVLQLMERRAFDRDIDPALFYGGVIEEALADETLLDRVLAKLSAVSA